MSMKNSYQQHIVLVCEGLDTLAEISINGTFLAKTDNMHRTWKFQAKKLLHPGKTKFKLFFVLCCVLSKIILMKPIKKNQLYSVRLHERKPAFAQSTLHVWLGLGSQTIDAGIFRDIYLQGYSHARIEDIRIHQQHAKNVSVQTSITLSESVPGQKTLRGTLRRRCRQTAADETV